MSYDFVLVGPPRATAKFAIPRQELALVLDGLRHAVHHGTFETVGAQRLAQRLHREGLRQRRRAGPQWPQLTAREQGLHASQDVLVVDTSECPHAARKQVGLLLNFGEFRRQVVLPDDSPRVAHVPAMHVVERRIVAVPLAMDHTDRQDPMAPAQEDYVTLADRAMERLDHPDRRAVDIARCGLLLVCRPVELSRIARSKEHQVMRQEQRRVVTPASARRDLPNPRHPPRVSARAIVVKPRQGEAHHRAGG